MAQFSSQQTQLYGCSTVKSPALEQLAVWVAICLDNIKVDGHGPLGLDELIIVHMLYTFS